jgi:hypothetical protein
MDYARSMQAELQRPPTFVPVSGVGNTSNQQVQLPCEPPTKVAKISIFASYQHRAETPAAVIAPVPVTELMYSYLAYIQSIAHGHERGIPWDLVNCRSQLSQLKPLLEHVFSGPCTSAPVERVFSHGGIFVRPHRASISDRVLCDLMMSKCNSAF